MRPLAGLAQPEATSTLDIPSAPSESRWRKHAGSGLAADGRVHESIHCTIRPLLSAPGRRSGCLGSHMHTHAPRPCGTLGVESGIPACLGLGWPAAGPASKRQIAGGSVAPGSGPEMAGGTQRPGSETQRAGDHGHDAAVTVAARWPAATRSTTTGQAATFRCDPHSNVTRQLEARG